MEQNNDLVLAKVELIVLDLDPSGQNAQDCESRGMTFSSVIAYLL